MLRHPAAPFVVPFAAFMLLLAVAPHLHPFMSQASELVLRVGIIAAILWYFSRHLVSFKFESPVASIAIGVIVFLVWVGPDMLIPGYRNHWLFQNSLTGTVASSLRPTTLEDPVALVFRSIRAILLVPILEELFWRGWLLRWLINPDFQKVAPGTYQRNAFLISSVLFALEHGPYWDVGFLAGAIYNGWMVRTKSWNDCILAHAVTNGCLSLFVIMTQRWEYWL